MKSKTDAELLADAATDADAFRELYDRHAQAIHRFLRVRTGDEQAALDLTAETFAQAWLSRRRFRDRAGGDARPWLYGIARNKLLVSVRRVQIENRAIAKLGMQLPPAESVPSEPEPRWIEGLAEALAELPESQREALQLRLDEDLGYDQVAARLGTTPQAARVRVHRALATLRRRLSPNSMEMM